MTSPGSRQQNQIRKNQLTVPKDLVQWLMADFLKRAAAAIWPGGDF